MFENRDNYRWGIENIEQPGGNDQDLFSVRQDRPSVFRVYLGVRACELFLCFVAIVRVRVIMLTSLFSLFYVTREFHRFLHQGRATFSLTYSPWLITSKLPNQRARKVLFTCVVYTIFGYSPVLDGELPASENMWWIIIRVIIWNSIETLN